MRAKRTGRALWIPPASESLLTMWPPYASCFRQWVSAHVSPISPAARSLQLMHPLCCWHLLQTTMAFSKMGIMALLFAAAIASVSAAHGGPYPYKYYVSDQCSCIDWVLVKVHLLLRSKAHHCDPLPMSAQAYMKGKFEVPPLVTKTWGFGYVEWNATDILVSVEVRHWQFSFRAIQLMWQLEIEAATSLVACTCTLSTESELLSHCVAHVMQLHNADGITAVHVHNGTMGVNGPVVIPVAGFMMPGTDMPQPVSGDFDTYVMLKTADYPWLPEFLSMGMGYFNAHSVANPGGEVRGQLYVAQMPEEMMPPPMPTGETLASVAMEYPEVRKRAGFRHAALQFPCGSSKAFILNSDLPCNVAVLQLSTFVAAVSAVPEILAGATDPSTVATVLAPTNAAFDAALATLGLSLEDLLGNTDTLAGVLAYHILTSVVLSAGVPAPPGAEVTTFLPNETVFAESDMGMVRGPATRPQRISCGSVRAHTWRAVLKGARVLATVPQVMFNEVASIVTADIMVNGGVSVIHIIDAVLLPSFLRPSSPPMMTETIASVASNYPEVISCMCAGIARML
eukprot:365966-Chlamydomonas_euryale.AAC.10